MSLVYLLTTLPILEYNKPAPLSMEQLFEMAKLELSQSQYQLLWDFIYDSTKITHPVLVQWVDWHRSLQHELSIFRAKDLGREERSHISTDSMPYAPTHLAEESLHALNPYVGQQHLREGEWDFLEQLSSTYYQNIVNLAIYAGKLRILILMDLYKPETGKERLEQYYANALTGQKLEAFWGQH